MLLAHSHRKPDSRLRMSGFRLPGEFMRDPPYPLFSFGIDEINSPPNSVKKR
jgi:hypothetical protein